MFIGEGPGRFEEEAGEPFVGKSGELLRKVLTKLKFEDYYLTNLVACRSCEAVIDPDTNTPKMRKGKGGKPDEIVYRDVVPTPTQIQACAARLYEEIYLVDPVVIVALGVTAAEFLTGRSVSITRERGNTVQIEIPGATNRPVLTDKKQVWGRKVHGVYQLPTETNMVTYTTVLSMHPSYVTRKENDLGLNSPIKQFVADIRAAVKIYEKHLVEALGVEPTVTPDVDLTDMGEEDDAEQELA